MGWYALHPVESSNLLRRAVDAVQEVVIPAMAPPVFAGRPDDDAAAADFITSALQILPPPQRESVVAAALRAMTGARYLTRARRTLDPTKLTPTVRVPMDPRRVQSAGDVRDREALALARARLGAPGRP